MWEAFCITLAIVAAVYFAPFIVAFLLAAMVFVGAFIVVVVGMMIDGVMGLFRNGR